MATLPLDPASRALWFRKRARLGVAAGVPWCGYSSDMAVYLVVVKPPSHLTIATPWPRIVKGNYLNGNRQAQSNWFRDPAGNIMYGDKSWPPIKARLEAL